MSASYNFRSAFNGFHREDVVHYIEYINSKHTSQLNQLKSDLAAAQKENETLRAKPSKETELEDRATELSAKVARLESELLTAEQAWADLEKELAEVKTQRDQALAANAESKRRSEDELEAYRRAERMERQARERTDSMYHRANGVIADATTKVDDAAGTLSGLTDQVVAQLEALRSAVTAGKHALTDAAASLYAIRPQE